MTKSQLIDYINCGREIEFRYKGHMYSITYGQLNGKPVISFCQFYQETTEVDTAESLLQVTRNGVTVLSMLESLSEDDIWLF